MGLFDLLGGYKDLHGHTAVVEIQGTQWWLYNDLGSTDPIASGDGEQSLIDALSNKPVPQSPDEFAASMQTLVGTPDEKKTQAHSLMANQLRWSGFHAAMNVYESF